MCFAKPVLKPTPPGKPASEPESAAALVPPPIAPAQQALVGAYSDDLRNRIWQRASRRRHRHRETK